MLFLKKLSNIIPEWLALCFLVVSFAVAWPLIFIVIGTKSLFSDKQSNKEKIAGGKMAIITLIAIIILGIIISNERYFTKIFSYFSYYNIIFFVIFGLIILVILQKFFPNILSIRKK